MDPSRAESQTKELILAQGHPRGVCDKPTVYSMLFHAALLLYSPVNTRFYLPCFPVGIDTVFRYLIRLVQYTRTQT